MEANVTESLTKITLSGNSKIQFHQHAEKMEFLASNPNTFKPGLPYTAYVSTGTFIGIERQWSRFELSVKILFFFILNVNSA